MNYVAFDLEIATIVPEGIQDWGSCMPLGISCAATLRSDEAEPKVWHGGLERRQLQFEDLTDDPEQRYNERMSVGQCDLLALYLIECQEQGFPVVTWNGAGFDFWVLAEECSKDQCLAIPDLVLNHIDMGFHMLCVKGYMVGLDTAAKGLEVGGKTEGMHGALAPVMWQENWAEQEKVLEYVAQDARATAAVYEALQAKGVLPWISRKGYQQSWFVGKQGLLSVKEANKLPRPDTGWMTKPRSRESHLEWMKG